MSIAHAALLLWLEAVATAIAYAAAGAGAARRGRDLIGLAAALVIHAAVATVAWRLAGGPGDGGALAAVRALVVGEALVAWGAAALGARLRLDPGIAAALAALLVVALVVAPAPAEAIARGADDPVTVRTVGFALSPPYAASVALGLDILHDAALYGRFPAAVMEKHMTPWIWTAGGLLAAGLLFVFAAVAGRPRRTRRVLAAALLIAAVTAGCKKKAPAGDKPVTTAPAAAGPATDAGAAPTGPAAVPAAGAHRSPAEIDRAIVAGVDFLAKARGDGDLIGGHPGSTALAVLAMVSAGIPAADARVAPSLAALVKLARPDGGIFDKDFPVYVTAIAALAFQRAGVHPDLVAKAQRWLADKQFGEGHGVDAKNLNFGGIGYGVDDTHPDADLSNLHFALDAIKDAPLTDRAEVMARAQRFLERCQNRSESNDQPWASDDGGFVYKPGASKAGGTASSGSMTYAGIAGFLYTHADASDPRVASALTFIRANYSVDENPGLGSKGLYYHFHMMARALGLVGTRQLVDADGVAHDWPSELADKLIGLQHPDGSWANPDATYWENNPAIAGARAVLALDYARDAMK